MDQNPNAGPQEVNFGAAPTAFQDAVARPAPPHEQAQANAEPQQTQDNMGKVLQMIAGLTTAAQETRADVGQISNAMQEFGKAMVSMRKDVDYMMNGGGFAPNSPPFEDFAQDADLEGKTLVRLRPYDKRQGHTTRRLYFMGHLYEVGRWYAVGEETAHHLGTLLQDQYDQKSPSAFEIVTPAEARRIDMIEQGYARQGDWRNPLTPSSGGGIHTGPTRVEAASPNPGRAMVAIRE